MSRWRLRRPRPRVGRRASFAESASFGALSFAGNVLLALATSIVVARLYGVEVVGQYALILAPAGLLNGLSTLREQTALVRELSTLEPREPRVTGLALAVFSFSTGLTVTVGLIAAAVVTLVLSGPVGQPDLVAPALVLIANYVLLVNVTFNSEAVLLGFRAGRQLFFARQLQSVAYLLLAAAAVLVTDDVWGLVAAMVGSTFVALVARLRRLRPFLTLRISGRDAREGFRALPGLIRYGVRFVPGSMSDSISNETGTLILGVTSPVAAVGAWSRSWMLSRRLAEPAYRVSEVLFPTLVERRAGGDRSGFDVAAVDSARYSAVGLLVLASAGGGAAYGVMAIFGPGFERAADALALLLLMPVAFALGQVQLSILASVDRPMVASLISLAKMLIIIALAIPLGIAYEVTGVAAAFVIGYGVDVVARSVFALPHLSTPLRRLWPPRQMAALVLGYAAGFAAARMTDGSAEGVLGTLLALAAGVAAFIAVFVITGGVHQRDREGLRRLRVKRRARAAEGAATVAARAARS